MENLSDLERAAIEAIIDEVPNHRLALQEQLRTASVVSRRNTGGGFYAGLATASDAPEIIERKVFGDNVYALIPGLDYGIGLILFMRDGRMHLLEGFGVGIASTSSVDFATTPFQLTKDPAPWSGGS
jgi:hypothetical protein